MREIIKIILARFSYLMKWESKIYGYLHTVKEFIKYPKFLPLYLHLEHGWDQKDSVYSTDISTGHQIILVFNKRRQKLFAPYAMTPITMGCPMLMHIKTHHIKRHDDAIGTIVFPAKGGNFGREIFDIHGFCQNLKQLPQEFYPITVCLTDYGMNEENIATYRSYGFEIITAGYHLSFSFTKRFCELLLSYKYACSNILGTYVLPCMELGIPFFLLRNGNVMYENDGRDTVHDKLFSYDPEFNSEHKALVRGYEIFSYKYPMSITAEQREFFDSESGKVALKYPVVLLLKIFFYLIPFYIRQTKDSMLFALAATKASRDFNRSKRFAIYGAGKSGKNLQEYLTKCDKEVVFLIDDNMQDCKTIIDFETSISRSSEFDAIFLGTTNIKFAHRMQKNLLNASVKKPIFYSPSVAYLFESSDERYLNECSSAFCEIDANRFSFAEKVFIETAKFKGCTWRY